MILSAFEPDEFPGAPNTGNPVFELRLNTINGDYEFRLFDELIHKLPDPLGTSEQNFDLRSGAGFVDKIDFGSIIQVTDYDGDGVVLDDDFFIQIRDDVPEAKIKLNDHKEVIHDETPGDDGDHDKSFGSLPGSAQTAFNGLASKGNDPDVTPGNPNDAIGYAHNSSSIVTTNFTELGADHPPAVSSLSLEINGVDGLDSGLDVTDGASILLYKEGNLIVGRVDPASASVFAGKAAFAVHINQDGEISVGQWLSIKHDDINDHDENNDNGNNSGDEQDNPADNQSPNPIQQTLSGKINAVYTLTDSDGDTDTDSVGVGSRIVFEDDGPDVKHLQTTGQVVTVDETSGTQNDDVASTPALLALFAGVSTPGTDPHMSRQIAQSTGAIVSFSVDYGADGPKPGQDNALVYTLHLSGSEVDSGLDTTEGKSIHLFKEGDLIVGRYEDDSGDNPEQDDPAAFAIYVDPATGQITVIQYVSLKHDDRGDNDENNDDGSNSNDDQNPNDNPNPVQQWINSDTIFVGVTATDGDGDYDLDKVDIGKKITFEDDGPTVGGPAAISVDEDDLAWGNSDVQAGDDLNDPSALTVTGSVIWDAGADGPKTMTFTSLHGDNVQTQGGANVTSNDVQLRYYWDGGSSTLYASTNVSTLANAINTAAFKITVTDVAAGNFSFTLLGNVDHPTVNTEDNLILNVTVDFTDGDDDPAQGLIIVNIDDDIPVIGGPANPNQIVNGDFNQGTFEGTFFWGTYALPGNLPGWTVAGDPTDPPSSLMFEISGDNYLGLSSSTNNGMLDLGASPGNYQVSQTVNTLTTGEQYVISFEVGAPFPGTALMQVLWGNTVIGVIDTTKSTGELDEYSYIVTASANAADNKITFREIGTGNAPVGVDQFGNSLEHEGFHGTYIDNVQMYRLNGVVDEDGLTPPDFSDGVGDSQIGDAPGNATVNTGALGISWGADNDDAGDGASQDGALTTLSGRFVTFTNNNVEVTGVSGPLKSHGDVITWQLTENNTKLVGVAGSGDNVRTVVEVKLFDDGSGSYRFEIFDQLDHADGGSENDIALGFNFTATDSDGDTATGTFAVGVDDDISVAKEGSCFEIDERETPPTPGKDANFVLVLNSSNSIDNSQLNLIKQNAIDFLNQLAGSGAENIRVHLVDFDSNSAVAGGTFDIVLNGQPQDDAGDTKGDQLQAAINAINALTADGFTNYEASLAQAKEWIEGGTLTVTNSHAFDADTNDGENTARVLVDSNDVRIAIVSAWEAGSLDNVGVTSGDGIAGGFGVNTGDELDETDEILRFDFGAFNDFDGGGEYGRSEEAVGFRGSDISAATFSLRSFDNNANTVNYTVFYTDGTNSGALAFNWSGTTLTNQTITAPSGKLISHIQFTVPANEDGLIDLELVTLPVEGPIPAADVNSVIFISDGEPNRALGDDGSVTSENTNDAISQSQNEITAIETAGPGQAFTIEAFGANTNASGINVLNQIDTGGAAQNITTNNGLSTALASLIASLGGTPGSGGIPSSIVFDLQTLVDSGADEDVTFTFKTDVSSLDAQDIKSGGVELNYVVVGNVLTAYKGAQIPANEIFKVTLNPDGTGTFELLGNIDQSGGVEHIELGAMISAFDFDKDPVVGELDFCIKVEGNDPLVQNAAFTALVEEEHLNPSLSVPAFLPITAIGNEDENDANNLDTDEDFDPGTAELQQRHPSVLQRRLQRFRRRRRSGRGRQCRDRQSGRDLGWRRRRDEWRQDHPL